ncbi:single-stranded-DNA-specific exonuclease RecJ [Scytonema sp. HK-05]|uniref:single-stranded-DNA-specific exonuclease RecJ n=1 Tax=Scytonema sp. HK-05 TaxID=1137095 RepID=UPI000936FB36|nr:DHH family phosphoesterase [Scytonema sp. HK-05]OKH58439.1 single-stranded-DNA-specific exonuclease RecJ [Scytonema sp. HK-05]BAY49306.1 single-stranded-DNA-specific exonuclease RecJ [Scytonema sp. HK-05]
MSNQSTPEFSRLRQRLPDQRWQISPQKTESAQKLAEVTNLPPLINQLLINRGIETKEQAQAFLNSGDLVLPSPLDDFPDLAMSLELLEWAIASGEKIAICGDYDADGMTSTALLLRSLRWLGAQVDYAIPSRMHEGYGINKRIIEEFHSEGVGLILTVDNGISAFEPIARARELGLKVIITDHHDIPQQLPPANAILNPKLIRESSPYRGIAGVGVAYILAVSLAEKLGQANDEILASMLELFTLGTIADLAPLTGVNRHWVKSGLQQLPKSKLAGVQALIQMSGVQASGAKGGHGDESIQNTLREAAQGASTKFKIQNSKSLKPEDIGFRLGPRINAIGRIADPQIVIELLTTDDMGIALERAMQCEAINRQRREMCEQIEQEAIEIVETEYFASLPQDRVLVIVQHNWHHGVIGIVASRLVERYGVPVFIGTYENETHIRGSARGIPEFHIFDALEYCQDLLGKFGGHKAAGGFSLLSENLEGLRSRLSEFANKCLELQHLKPLLKIDTQANLSQIHFQLYQQLNVLEPCGIENPDPVFWTPDVRVIEQQTVGKGHIKLTVSQTIDDLPSKIKAIAWRWRDYFPLPPRLDIAYKLRENHFNGNTTIELELVGVRLPTQSHIFLAAQSAPLRTTIQYNQRHYSCGIYKNGSVPELRIGYPEGKILAVELGHTIGLVGTNRQDAMEVDVSQGEYNMIIQTALQALSVLSNGY